MTKKTAIASLVVAIVGGLGLSGSGAPGAAQAATGGSGAVQQYLNRLQNAASDKHSFGYFQYQSQTSVRLGFVGPVPRRIHDLIADAPAGAEVSVARSVYSKRQMDSAAHKALRSPYKVYAVSELSMGRGLKIYSESPELVESRSPIEVLDISVGVIVKKH